MDQKSLREKTVKGIGWSAADAFLGQGVSFLVGLVLARLLSPSEYGLIGICTIFVTVLTGIVDSGFSNALIRKNDVTSEDYNTMFITNMVISISLYLGLYYCAPIIAVFFKKEELVQLVRYMGLILFFQALSITQVTILTKRIDFKTKTKASLIAAVCSGVIGISMALCGYGVWALVGQHLSKQLLYTLCLWSFNTWKPSFCFSLHSFKNMWGFGWKLMLSGLLNNTWNHLYQIVVGKFYSPSTLGQYSRAREYAHIFSSNFTAIVQRVSFPVLAEVQDDKIKMVAGYRRIIKATMFVTVICLVSLGAVSEPLIYCLIGPKWHQAASFMPLICLSLSLHPLHAINLNMLQVQGRSDIYLGLEIVKKIISIAPLCLGIFIGIYWMLVGSIVLGLISFFLNSYYTGKALNYSSWMQLKDVAPSYCVGFCIAISVYFLKYLPFSPFIVLPIQVVVGTAVLIIVCERMQLSEYFELKNILHSYVIRFFS